MKVDAVQTIKYVCILLMIVYTISSFEILSVRSMKRQKLRFHFHNLLIFTFHFLANLSLIIQQSDWSVIFSYLLFYLGQLAFFALYLILYRLIYRGCNPLLLNHTIMFLSISFTILLRLSPAKAHSQLLYACLASAVSLLIPYIATKVRLTKALAGVLGVLGLLLLAAVFVRGKVVYGANLSLNLFGIAVQPSEFVKISFILLIAMLFRKDHSFRRVCFATCIALAHVGVLMISKDLGNALIFFVTYLFMLYAATHTIKYSLLGLTITGLIGMGIFFLYQYAVHFEGDSPLMVQIVRMFSHVETRVNNWIDPWATINDDGYQIVQSLFAILSGGWFGTGLGKGYPTEIPVVAKDFTYAAICEEFGGLIALCLIFICLSLLLSILLVAVRMKNTFYKLMATGFASVYGIQVFLVVGGVTKMIPHTGVTLPLISYGGSSVSSTLFLFALTQGLTVLWRKEEREEKREEKRKLAKIASLETGSMEMELPAAEETNHQGEGPLRPTKSKKTIQKQIEKQQETPKINRNKEVFGVAYMHTMAFFAMAIYLIVLLSKPSDDLLNNSYNRVRLNASVESILRGTILSSDGEILATSVLQGDQEERVYPQGNVTSHVVGYLTGGKTGLEYLANFWLTKTDNDFWDRFQSEIFGEKQMGYSVYSTINLKAQQVAEKLLQDKTGAIVALDAKTGDVLVMVSKPDFDPATLQPVNTASEDDGTKDSYLMNRAVSGLYPPGSSFKPLMMLAYMRAYPNTWQQEVYDCNGEFVLEDHIIHCDHGSVHGTVDFTDALCVSCNGYFANLARSISVENFNNTMSSLLFRKQLTAKTVQGVTTIPALSTALSNATMKSDMTTTQRAIMGIGQGSVQISPIHSALITAAIANGGHMPAPRYFTSVVNSKNQLIYEAPFGELGQVMTTQEAEILKKAMETTLIKGTGYNAASTDYLAGGKTGSAQFITGSTNTHAIYTGFGEYEGRIIAIACFIENGGSGGQVAAPIAKEILDTLFDITPFTED